MTACTKLFFDQVFYGSSPRRHRGTGRRELDKRPILCQPVQHVHGEAESAADLGASTPAGAKRGSMSDVVLASHFVG